jgi:cytochrome c peroxidase
VYSNNGLDSIKEPEKYPDKGRGWITGNKNDYGKFKVPSLRNIGLTAPYMHDGRFKNLEEVLKFYNEGLHASVNIDSKMGFDHKKGLNLPPADIQKIIRFLLTLNDSTFISDPAFGNPFQKNQN